MNEEYAAAAGYSEGGYTGAGAKYQVRGYTDMGEPVHADEYVVRREELYNPAFVPMIRAIEAERQRHVHNHPLPAGYGAGYADGGYTGNAARLSKPVPAADPQLSMMIMSELHKLFDKKLKAEVNYFEFQDAKRQMDNIQEFIKKR